MSIKSVLLTSTLLAGAALAGAPALAQTAKPPMPPERMAAAQPPKADADMQKVLDAFKALDPKPLPKLTAAEARKQPSMADAVKKVMADGKMDVNPREGLTVENIMIPGPAGEIKARTYKPAGAGGDLPVIVYYHGGGWVIADLDTYDASAAALAKMAKAIVVSAHYRQGPEHKLPAAHQDAFAAYKWVAENAAKLGGDADRMAVAGESAGGNLAVNVAMMARDYKAKMPVHQLIIYPVAGLDMTTPSYQENANAKPLDKAAMQWFVENATIPGDPELADEKVVDLLNADLKGLPPATLITAEIDPLRSEGEMLAEKMKAAGNKVTHQNYDGVTHEFFGAAAVVADARKAQEFAAKQLSAAFTSPATGSVDKAGDGKR